MRRVLILPLGVLLMAGCAQSTDSTDTGPAPLSSRDGMAEGSGRRETETTAAYLQEPRFAEADIQRGELLSLACQACHTLGAGQEHLLGPNLYGIFGRVSAGSDGFDYSAELRSAKLAWTPAVLEAWLADPAEFLPGNNMVFAGYSSATDRRDLIAFLLHKTGGLAE